MSGERGNDWTRRCQGVEVGAVCRCAGADVLVQKSGRRARTMCGSELIAWIRCLGWPGGDVGGIMYGQGANDRTTANSL